MRLFIASLILLATASPGVAKSLTEKAPKLIRTTGKPSADVAACVSEGLSFWSQKSSLPAPGGGTRIQLASLYLTLTDILIVPRDAVTAVELRGKAYGKVKKAIEACL